MRDEIERETERERLSERSREVEVEIERESWSWRTRREPNDPRRTRGDPIVQRCRFPVGLWIVAGERKIPKRSPILR